MPDSAVPAEAGMIELVAPGGVDEANHGTERYRVDNDGRIRVPHEAAFWLIRAGFKPVPTVGAGMRSLSETTAPTEDGDGAEPATDPRRVPRRSNRT